MLFIFITTPTSSHALMRAAFEDDEMPLGEKDLKNFEKDPQSQNQIIDGIGTFQYDDPKPVSGGGIAFTLGKRFGGICSSLWNIQLSDVPALGGNGCSRCCLY